MGELGDKGARMSELVDEGRGMSKLTVDKVRRMAELTVEDGTRMSKLVDGSYSCFFMTNS